MTTTPNLPPLPEGVADEARIFRANLLVMPVEQAKAYALAAYQAGRDAGLDDAANHLMKVGAAQNSMGKSVVYSDAARTVRALKSDTKGGV